MKPVNWTDNAREKLRLVQNQGFIIDEDLVLNAIRQPRRVDEGYSGRLIAQAVIDGEHTIRVVYEETDVIAVVTLYPGRRSRYEG